MDPYDCEDELSSGFKRIQWVQEGKPEVLAASTSSAISGLARPDRRDQNFFEESRLVSVADSFGSNAIGVSGSTALDLRRHRLINMISPIEFCLGFPRDRCACV